MDNERRAIRNFHRDMIEAYEKEALLEKMRMTERRIMDRFGDCTCAQAPMCPVFRPPGDLFKNGIPESVKLPWAE